jgi:hypothetical protein
MIQMEINVEMSLLHCPPLATFLLDSVLPPGLYYKYHQSNDPELLVQYLLAVDMYQ